MADTNGELTSITEPDPGGGSPVWQFGYTGNYLTSETDPNSNLSSFSLDSYHRLSQTALPGGGGTSDTSEQDFGYGSTSQSNPGSVTLESSVTPSGTDAMGNQQSFQTDSFGEVISQTDSYGNTTLTQRDANGLPTVITQPPPASGDASPVTTISYDALGNETSATGVMPSYGTTVFNTLSEPTSFTDLLGHEWLLNYSTSGNLLSEQDPTGDQVSWTFDSYGAPLTMTTPTPGNVAGTVTTHFHYDQYERLVESSGPTTARCNSPTMPTTGAQPSPMKTTIRRLRVSMPWGEW